MSLLTAMSRHAAWILGFACAACVAGGLVLCESDRTGPRGRVGVWLIVAPFLVLPALMVVWLRLRLHVHRWKHTNCCQQCGYSRRALPNSKPCPECGDIPGLQ